jgi:Cft2 family RNA processing exonuclease
VGSEVEGKGAADGTPAATSSKILLDGKEVKFTAYYIGGSTYFKLRDNGEAFGFGVDWDGTKNTIIIDTGKR